jgi:hypothetical protein
VPRSLGRLIVVGPALLLGWAPAPGCGGRSLGVHEPAGGAGTGGSTSGEVAGQAGTGAGGATGGGGPGGTTCADAQVAYDELHAELARRFRGLPCLTDADCTPVPEANACGPPCPNTALTTAGGGQFLASLKSDADVCNSVCPPQATLFCPPNPVVCQNGACAFAGIDCVAQECLAPSSCPTGFHVGLPVGQCCEMCVRSVSKACNDAETAYTAQRSTLLEKYGATSCLVDADCAFVFESNACVTTCGEALPTSTAVDFSANLMMLAVACDAACPLLPPPPCVQLTAICSNGTCTAARL